MKLTIIETVRQSRMRCSRTLARAARYAVCIALGCLSGLPPTASAATVYVNDFQGAVGSEWSNTSVDSAPHTDYAGTRLFLGQFGNEAVSLSLSGLPTHAYTTVSFSLYLIRSWDGNENSVVDGDPLGPDTWSLGVAGGPPLLSATFSNGGVVGQSYAPDPFSSGCTGYNLSGLSPGEYNPMTGASECYSLGYLFSSSTVNEESMDSVYNLSFTFAHSASDLTLNFLAQNLQGIDDESWGLDNVQVSISEVPVPAAMWLFGSGLIGLLGFSWRRSVVKP